MTALLNLIGGFFLVAGTAFLALGGLGLLRMPDVYNRIQAGAKTTTLGTLLTLLGVAFLQPAWSFKLLLIGVFLLFTNPISSQVLARSAHRTGAAQTEQMQFDKLKDDLGDAR